MWPFNPLHVRVGKAYSTFLLHCHDFADEDSKAQRGNKTHTRSQSNLIGGWSYRRESRSSHDTLFPLRNIIQFHLPTPHEYLLGVRNYVQPNKYLNKRKGMVSKVLNRLWGSMTGSLLMLPFLLANLFSEISAEKQNRKRTLGGQVYPKSFSVWNILINRNIYISHCCFKPPRVKNTSGHCDEILLNAVVLALLGLGRPEDQGYLKWKEWELKFDFYGKITVKYSILKKTVSLLSCFKLNNSNT